MNNSLLQQARVALQHVSMRDSRVKVLKLREELAEAHFHGFRACRTSKDRSS